MSVQPVEYLNERTHAARPETRKLISFAIPVFRNKGALTLTHEKIRNLFATSLTDFDYEIVFVDDGSDDGSYEELMELQGCDDKVRVISFTRNFGQMAAMLAGIQHARGDAVVSVSADLQDPVELVEQMCRHWLAGAELTICHRYERSDSLASRLYSKVAYSILRLSLPQLPAGGFDYVLMDRRVVDQFNAMPARNRFFQGDLLWMGYRTAFVPYTRLERKIGRSQYNFWKKLKNFLDAVLDASYLPIRVISAAGIITAIVGLLYGLTVVGAWLVGATPFEGWAALMIVVLLIGGMIMVMLGIIGEYVWRIFDQVRGKPNYVIRSMHNIETREGSRRDPN